MNNIQQEIAVKNIRTIMLAPEMLTLSGGTDFALKFIEII